MKWSHTKKYLEPGQGRLSSSYYQELKERDQEKILKDDASLAHCHGISKECTFHPIRRNSSVPLVHSGLPTMDSIKPVVNKDQNCDQMHRYCLW